MMSLYKFPNMIALKEDDSMDIKFLKELGESCIRELEQFHLTNRCKYES